MTTRAFSDRSFRTSVLRDHRTIPAEPVVDAGLDGVDVETERQAGSRKRREIGLVAVACEHVFALSRPCPGKRPFGTAADRPAAVVMRFCKPGQKTGRADFVVHPAIAALGIEQRRARRDAGTARDGSERLDLVLDEDD